MYATYVTLYDRGVSVDRAAQVKFGGKTHLVGWPGSFSVPHPFSMRSFLITRAKPPLHK
jgi:hypothetical protein